MATPAKAKPEGILGLSAGEAKILILGFLCITDQYKVDYEKLATRGGYTAGSANVLFNKAKRKLVELNPDNSAENGSSATTGEASSSKSATTTPKKGQAKRKKAAAGTEDGGADGEEAATPTKPKRQRKIPVKKGAAAKAGADADVDNVENGNGAPEVKAEASKSEGIIKNELMEEGNDDSELTIKAELDEVMDDADLDAELDALDAAQRDVKAEDHTA